MKPFILTLFLSLSIILISEQTLAQDRGFGVGAQITSPAGISIKNWISPNSAIASTVSFNISENSSSFYTSLDYLIHKRYDETDWEIGYLTYYYGGGARFIWNEFAGDSTFWAIRLPSGLNFNFTEIPVDFYLEVAPTLEVNPAFDFGFSGGIGFRYFLN